MADLTAYCYGQVANDGNIQCPDRYLGKVTISTLSSTSQSGALEKGTRFVRLATDATETVYFAFDATATTSDDEIRADLGEYIRYVGSNGKEGTINARIAA